MLQLADLTKVAWTKDSGMADFLDRWEKVVNRLQFRPTDEHLRDVLLIQLRKSAALKHQLEQWDQMEDEDASKTYEWLISQVQREIDQRRMRTNLQDMRLPSRPRPSLASTGRTVQSLVVSSSIRRARALLPLRHPPKRKENPLGLRPRPSNKRLALTSARVAGSTPTASVHTLMRPARGPIVP